MAYGKACMVGIDYAMAQVEVSFDLSKSVLIALSNI